MLKEKYYFEFRFEEELKQRAILHCRKLEISLNRLVEAALRFTTELHDKGKILFIWRSQFLARQHKEDQFSPMLILDKDMHEMVRNYAFAYRKSMAEILRISMELYFHYLESDSSKLDNALHYYNDPVPVIKQVIIHLIPGFPPGIPPEHYNTVIYTHF